MRDVAPPHLVSYAVTRECNLKCKHCYSDAVDRPAPDELSTLEAKMLLDNLADWGIHLLIFDGGEPLCRDDFFDIAKYASGKRMRIVVGSNGTLIDAELAGRMKDVGVQAVQISIDGARPETHDSFRGEEGSFDRAMRGVEACKHVGLPFQFGMVIRKQSLPEVPSMLELAVKSGANAAEFFDLVQVPRVRKECPGEILNTAERKNGMCLAVLPFEAWCCWDPLFLVK